MTTDRQRFKHPGGRVPTQRLARYEQRYRRLTAQLTEIGFVSDGTLLQRYTTCGKPNCRCRADPPQRHGPYWDWTRKVAGKTISRRLSDAEADLYRTWIANDRRLEAITTEMRGISRKAADLIIRQATKR